MVRTTDVDASCDIQEGCVLQPAVNFDDLRVPREVDFDWCKLILKLSCSEGTVAALSPTEDFAVVGADKGVIASTAHDLNAVSWELVH